MNDSKLSNWIAAGIIDVETANAIRTYETSHAKPVALIAVVGVAALAIGLGVILVVAANWDAIAPIVRLSLHIGLMLMMALGLCFVSSARYAHKPWLFEAGLLLFGITGLAFMGHLGQVYQTTSPLWQPLGLWLLLFGPVLLLRGTGWMAATAFMLALALAGLSFAAEALDRELYRSYATSAFAAGLPIIMAGIAAWFRTHTDRAELWRRIEQLAIIYAVAGASLAMIIGGWQNNSTGSQTILMVLAAMLAITAAAIFYIRNTPSGRSTAAIVACAALAAVLLYPLSASRVMCALLFMAFWAVIAAASLHAAWRGLFQLAVAAIALRLIFLSFELQDNLLSNGTGLILSGMLMLGVAFAAITIGRRYAPAKAAIG